MFLDYFLEGLYHILDPNGYDHLVFLVALCVPCDIRYFKRVLLLATAFTIGHSVTLALAAFEVVLIRGSIIEFLIPVTIFVTAMRTVIYPKRSERRNYLGYAAVLFFGFIHGMGFSTLLRMKLHSGQSIAEALLAFNLGIEVGQLAIVAVFLLLTTWIQSLSGVRTREWILGLSAACAGIALVLIHENWPW